MGWEIVVMGAAVGFSVGLLARVIQAVIYTAKGRS